MEEIHCLKEREEREERRRGESGGGNHPHRMIAFRSTPEQLLFVDFRSSNCCCFMTFSGVFLRKTKWQNDESVANHFIRLA